MTPTQVAEKWGYTEAEVLTLRERMCNVWSYLAGDCYEFMDDPDDESGQVELIVDADRLRSHWGAGDEDLCVRFYRDLSEHPLSKASDRWDALPMDIYTARRSR
jgi:hypothetical protein